MHPPHRDPPRGSAVAKLVLAAASVGLVLVAAEIVLRVTEDVPWYERLPEVQRPATLHHYPVGGETFPLRHPPLRLPKLPGSVRLLFLGDSFTYGSGVRERSTFVHRVTERLDRESVASGGPSFESFNGGIPASMTDDWVRLFDAVAEEFAPDRVIVVFFLRDGVSGVTSIGQIQAIRERMQRSAEHSFLHRVSALYRWAVDRAAQRRLSAEYLGRLRDGYTGDAEATREWRSAQANLRSICSRSRQIGARCALVIFPVLFGLEADYPLAGAIAEIERFARSEDIPALSLLPAFAGRDAEALWVSPLDQHPNEEAHAIAAEAIHDFLRPQIESD